MFPTCLKISLPHPGAPCSHLDRGRGGKPSLALIRMRRHYLKPTQGRSQKGQLESPSSKPVMLILWRDLEILKGTVRCTEEFQSLNAHND